MLWIGLVFVVTAVLGSCYLGKEVGEKNEKDTALKIVILFICACIGCLSIFLDGLLVGTGKLAEISTLVIGQTYDLADEDSLIFVRVPSKINQSTRVNYLALNLEGTKLTKKDFPPTFVLYKDKDDKLKPAAPFSSEEAKLENQTQNTPEKNEE
jgi:hypothetical protein